MKDDLTILLNAWQPEVPEPVGFKRGVWQRIAASRANVSPGLLESFFALIARPRMAVALAAMAIVAGGVAGNSIAGAYEADAYLRSVNPYVQAR